MSELTEFKCFPLLAREIQDLIWSFTFWPQTITFHVVEIATSSQESNHSSIKPFMGYKVTDIQTPAAFFVSKATRALALSQNYQTWRISQPDGKARSFLWNPATDIIFADVSNTKDFDLLDLDTQSVKQIQKLAFPYEFWDDCFKTHSGIHRVAGRVNGRFGQWTRRRSSRVLLRLMRTPSSLRELFIVVDNEFFQKEVEGKMGDQMGWWCTPGAIGTGFYEVMRKVLKLEQDSAKLPKISVASSFEMIWHGRCVELH